MTEPAKVVTTDQEIDAALHRAKIFSKYDHRAVRAGYSARTDRVTLQMEDGVSHSFPRRLLQGLSDAPRAALSKIELLENGTGLFWPALDVAHSVSGLLAGVYGSAKWMSQLHLETDQRRISA